MFALILALALLSPLERPASACDEQGFPARAAAECRRVCSWWSRAEQRCRDVDVEYLGEWDPRPAPGEWGTVYYASPPSWGAYATEKRE